MTLVSHLQDGAIAGASARGASHVRREKPNQDAFGGWRCGPWMILAVSDGHGGEAYFRSERGAAFAVAAARVAIVDWTADSTGAADGDRLQAGLAMLPRNVASHWRAAVASDIVRDPLPALPASQNPYLAYGATCLAAAIGPGTSLFLQIGDGDMLASAPGGELLRPLADEGHLSGEQTHSLCQPDAPDHFRITLFRAPHPLARPGFVIASSDGLSKSFAQERQFLDIAGQWRSLVEQNGIGATTGQLEQWLANCSERGSGDDITAVMYQSLATAGKIRSPFAMEANDVADPAGPP